MRCMACMRMSLIHAILPKGCKATIQFSPSHKHLLKQEELSNKCVLCNIDTPAENTERHRTIKEGREEEVEELNFRKIVGNALAVTDENIMDGDEWSNKDHTKTKMNDQKKGKIIEIGPELCHASGSDCCHFAHEMCLQVLEEETTLSTCQ